MSRNNKRRTLINDSEYYEPLRKSRNIKAIEQYATPMMRNPSFGARIAVKTTKHIWKYGDRFSQTNIMEMRAIGGLLRGGIVMA
jgi:hypothetical protein